jgi:hypothetical protein
LDVPEIRFAINTLKKIRAARTVRFCRAHFLLGKKTGTITAMMPVWGGSNPFNRIAGAFVMDGGKVPSGPADEDKPVPLEEGPEIREFRGHGFAEKGGNDTGPFCRAGIGLFRLRRGLIPIPSPFQGRNKAVKFQFLPGFAKVDDFSHVSISSYKT